MNIGGKCEDVEKICNKQVGKEGRREGEMGRFLENTMNGGRWSYVSCLLGQCVVKLKGGKDFRQTPWFQVERWR